MLARQEMGGRKREKEMSFLGKGDNPWEGPKPRGNIPYMGSHRQLRLGGVWPLGEVRGGVDDKRS